MQPPNHMEPGGTTAGRRAVGAWITIAALFLVTSLALHPPPPTETEEFLEVVAAEGATWRVAHWLAAAALGSFVVAGLIALTVHDLSAGVLTKSAWAVLSVGAFTTMATALSEATVLANAAAAGDLVTFAAWQAFAKAAALGAGAFLGLAVAALGGSETRRRTPALPTWASWIAVPLGVAAFVGWMSGPVLGLPFGGPLWLVSSLGLGAWLAAYGIALLRLTTKKVALQEVTHA